MTSISDETVMRYVDGELDAAACAEIEAALASDPDLGARIELFAVTRRTARDAMRPLLDEPVPPALHAAVAAMVADATSGTAARTSITRDRPASILSPANDWRWRAAAACIALVVGGAAGYVAGSKQGPEGLEIAAVDGNAVASALGSVPTGGESALPDDVRFRAVSSFRDRDATLCREFELNLAKSGVVTAVACREADRWNMRFAVRMPASKDGYAPASASEALDAYLASIGAGEALDATDETNALKALP